MGVGKFRYGIAKIFATIANFRSHCENFAVVAKIDFRYHSEISLK